MSKFTRFEAHAEVCYHPYASYQLGGDHWVVTSSFSYELHHVGSKKWVHVPAGFLTDGATVPRMFWSLIPPWGQYGQVAILHDWLCDNMFYYDSTGTVTKQVPLARKEVDKIFGEALEVLNVPTVTRKTMEAGVNTYRVFSRTKPTKKIEAKQAVEAKIKEYFDKHGEYVFVDFE